jgi:putative NADH-flavin reductase
MKVLLLGATGRTGKLILYQLLERGHAVNVIVRDKAKVKISSPRLTIFEGSTLDEDLLGVALSECNAIISALNISRKSDFPWSALRTPKTLMSDTIKKIIALADSQNIKRIIVLSAWGVSEAASIFPGGSNY